MIHWSIYRFGKKMKEGYKTKLLMLGSSFQCLKLACFTAFVMCFLVGNLSPNSRYLPGLEMPPMCSSEKTSPRRRFKKTMVTTQICGNFRGAGWKTPITIDNVLVCPFCHFLSVLSSRTIMISMLVLALLMLQTAIPAQVRTEHQNAVERRGRVEIAAVARHQTGSG